MRNFPILDANIEAIHTAMQAGNLTCQRLVEAYLSRIAAYDRKGPSLNAVISVNPHALAIARELDRKLQTQGLTGPLHGIPVLLKDNIDTADMPTTGGSICLSGHRPPADAFLAARLKEAGAILLAKVNLHEFAIWGETASSVLGQTRNPYALERTPGGSSGGTGAGLAAAFGAIGIGTDTINSIRSPASANCLVGLRPTVGLVSRGGIIPYSLTQDTAGPITPTVRDAAIVLDVIAGYDPADAKTAWSVGNKPHSYLDYLDVNGLKGKRIGILHSFFGTAPEHHEVTKVMHRGLRLMREKGAVLVDINESIDSNQLVDTTSVHLYDLDADLSDYLAALPTGAPVHSLREIAQSGQMHPGVVDNIRKALSLEKSSPEYLSRLIRQLKLRDKIAKLMADNSLDAIVYPHQKRLVVPIGESQVERNGVLAAVTGFPAITLPAGFSEATAAAPLGVPVGIEFMGRPWSEPLLLCIGFAFEQAGQVRRPPLSTPPL